VDRSVLGGLMKFATLSERLYVVEGPALLGDVWSAYDRS